MIETVKNLELGMDMQIVISDEITLCIDPFDPSRPYTLINLKDGKIRWFREFTDVVECLHGLLTETGKQKEGDANEQHKG